MVLFRCHGLGVQVLDFYVTQLSFEKLGNSDPVVQPRKAGNKTDY